MCAARARGCQPQRPLFTHQGPACFPGLGPVADTVFYFRVPIAQRFANRRVATTEGRSQSHVRLAAGSAIRRPRCPVNGGSGSSAWRTATSTQMKWACRSVCACIWSSSQALLAASMCSRSNPSAMRPHRRRSAQSAPGRPTQGANTKPESSAMAGLCPSRAAWRALASAFSTKVMCGSSASEMPSDPLGHKGHVQGPSGPAVP